MYKQPECWNCWAGADIYSDDGHPRCSKCERRRMRKQYAAAQRGARGYALEEDLPRDLQQEEEPQWQT